MSEPIKREMVGKIKVGEIPLSCCQMHAEKIYHEHVERENERKLQDELSAGEIGIVNACCPDEWKYDLGKGINKEKYIISEHKRNARMFLFVWKDYWAGFHMDFPRILCSMYHGNYMFEFNKGYVYLFRIWRLRDQDGIKR